MQKVEEVKWETVLTQTRNLAYWNHAINDIESIHKKYTYCHEDL